MRFLAVAAIVLASHVAHAEIVTIEPAPEAPGAVEAGAAAVKEAIALTKAPDKWKAVFAFETIATQWPAGLHDCYVSLARLRVGTLTEAKLAWDLAILRGGQRPKWCTGDLASQLAKALRDAKFREVTIAVTPADAVVTWNNSIAVKRIASLWLPCGASCVLEPRQHSFEITAPGFETSYTKVTMTDTGAKLEVALAPEPKPVPVISEPVDAGSDHVPPPLDAGVSPPDAGPPARAPITVGSIAHKIPLKPIALGIGIGGAITAGIATYVTYYFRDHANHLYKTDPEFDDAKLTYENYDIASKAFAAISVTGFIVYVVLALRSDAPAVSVQQAPGTGAVLTYSGTFGGPR